MTQVFDGVVLGTTTELSVPAINGVNGNILLTDGLTSDQSLRIRLAGQTGPITTWALAFDIYVPSPANSYVGLAQLGKDTGDGDLFLHENGDGTMGLGISGQYDGKVAYDSWVRIVVTVTEDGNGNMTLTKYADGTLIGTQNAGNTDRFDIQPELGLTLFTDDDGETSPVAVSSVFFSTEIADVAPLLVAGAKADAGGFFAAAPSAAAVEIDFANADVTPRYGDAAVDLEGLTPEGEPAARGDSAFGLASQFGIELPGGQDISILSFNGYEAGEGLAVTFPVEAKTLTSYTAVWDIYLNASDEGSTALLRAQGSYTGAADFLVGADHGLGTDGQYDGKVPTDAWTRIALTVEDLGNGTSLLSKYIDGTLVGTQTVDTERFSIDTNKPLMLLADEFGNTGSGYIAHFGLDPSALSAADIAALGTVDADGPFDAPVPGSEPVIKPVQLVAEESDRKGGFFTVDTVDTQGLTFDAAFSFRITNQKNSPADGFAFRIDSADLEQHLGNGGGDMGVPGAAGQVVPIVSVVFDIWQNDSEQSANSVRLVVGGGPQAPAVVAQWNLPFKLVGGENLYSWVEYEGGRLKVYLSDTDQKPSEPLISQAVDIAAVVGDTAKFGFSGATGGENAEMKILNFDISTNDPDGPSGELLLEGRNDIDFVGDAVQTAPDSFDPKAPLQVGFDDNKPTPDFGFTDGKVIDDVNVAKPIKDMLVKAHDDPISYNLADVFGHGAHDFAVKNSNGDVVQATIKDGVLTLAFGDTLDYSDLVITAVSDRGETLTDNVRIRVAGENAYTFAIIPDTQDYPSGRNTDSQVMIDMMKWIADNADGKNIGFVSNVGDITNNNTEAEWKVANAAYDILRKAGIPFSVAAGNHDVGDNGQSNVRDTALFNKYFSTTYMAQDPTYGGAYDQEAGRIDNSYHLYDAPDGTGWLILSLEFGQRDDVMRWADDVLTKYADRKVMILEHTVNNFDGRLDSIGDKLVGEPSGYDYGLKNSDEGAWDGEMLWRQVVERHSNVVFTVGGHVFGDGAETTIDQNAFGYNVYQFVVNYQGGVSNEILGAGNEALGPNGGNGAIRLVTIDPDNGKIYTETYFSALDLYFNGSRETPEKSRDGLTGEYVGHEETLDDANLGHRAPETVAEAGDDQLVDAKPGADKATVTLSAADTVDQRKDVTAYIWRDADGHVIAEGREATVELGAGRHDITLTVETAHGVSSTDEVKVIVETDKTYFSDNFNDGNADGWYQVGEIDPATTVELGTDIGFNLPPIAEGVATGVLHVDALPGDRAVKVMPTGLHGDVKEFTLIYDLFVEEGHNAFTSLFQTDSTNKSDAELFVRDLGNGKAGIGIAGAYEGALDYGTWNRLAFTFKIEGKQQILNKYINGELVGTQVVDTDVTDGTRWGFNSAHGFYIMSDDDKETSGASLSAFTFVKGAMSGEAIAALGGVDANGPLASGAAGDVQLNFNGSLNSTDFGGAKVSVVVPGAPDQSFVVKGSANSRDADDALGGVGGTLYDLSGGTDNTFVKKGAMIGDMVLETSMLSLEEGTMGVVIRYDEATGDCYRFEVSNADNVRRLVRIENGVKTVLAEEAGGYTFYHDVDVKVVVRGSTIGVSLDGVLLFGGLVTDTAPLGAGTVGFYSSKNQGSLFDDITVRAPTNEADAGADLRIIDFDGDGKATATINASLSTGANPVITAGGETVNGNTLTKEFGPGRTTVVVTVGDDTDAMVVDVVTGDRIITAETFNDGSMDGWTIIDTTEFNGAGVRVDGSANWAVVDGALVEREGAYSRELTWTPSGASVPDLWQRGWSPLGDGSYALHKGTYALYAGNKALKNYAIEADITVPTAAGGVGFMLNYVDADNYTKLEIDAHARLATVVQVVKGYEEIVGRVRTTFTPGDTFHLAADVLNGKLQVTVDGHSLFSYPVVLDDVRVGSAGVYSWKAAGVKFDNVAIIELSNTQPPASDLVLVGNDKDDVLLGDIGNDVIQGLGGDDKLYGDGGDDTLIGAEGNDYVSGGAGSDALIGNEGADYLIGGAGDDVLDGGEGDDQLQGGTGSDTYVYRSGDGSDMIVETAASDDQDRLFLDDATRADVVIHRHGRDVEIGIAGKTITLKDQLAGNGAGVEVVAFADGSVLSADELAAAIVNRGPVVDQPAAATGDEEAAITGQIVARDADGDTLVYGIKDGFGPKNGTVSVNPSTGAWTYHPAADYNGADSFTVTVTDGHGGKVETVVTLAVRPVNDAPVAVADTGSVKESETKTFDLVANDLDVDGDILSLSGFAVVGVEGIALDKDAAKAAFSIDASGKLAFDGKGLFDGLTEGETAKLTLSYTVSDGHGGTATGQFTLTVDGEGKALDVVSGTAGSDMLFATDTGAAIDAGGGNDYVFGGKAGDVVEAGAGNDYVFGNGGNDVIHGGYGHDTLFGGDGDDILAGGAGNDRMNGGAGKDSFVFRTGFGHDTVMDFEAGDVIDLASSEIHDFASLAEHLSETALGTVITLDDGATLTLANITKDQLTADQFYFAA